MKNILLSSIFLVFCFHSSIGQYEHISITGLIVDAKNKAPLPFASIYLKGTSIGTVSNIEGAFVFHVPSKYEEDTITISMIGYESIERVFDDFKDGAHIPLEEKVLTLDEVIVNDKKPLSAKEIVSKAYQSIAINYPSKPYILEGFIRDLQNEDSVYVELLECAVKMQYQPNQVKKIPEIELVALKQSYVTEKHPWNDQWERSPITLFPLKTPDFQMLKDQYKYRLLVTD